MVRSIIIEVESQSAAALSLNFVINGCLATGTVKVHQIMWRRSRSVDGIRNGIDKSNRDRSRGENNHLLEGHYAQQIILAETLLDKVFIQYLSNVYTDEPLDKLT